MQTRRRSAPSSLRTFGSAFAVVLVLALATALVVPAVAGAAPDGGPTDQAATSDGGNVTERIVYFEQSSDRAPSAVGGERTTADLREEARHAAAPLHRLADRREGLTIRRQFWITSATLVEIDTSRVSIDRLRAIDGVAAVEPNARIQSVGPVDARGDSSAAGTLSDSSDPEPTADSPSTASVSTTSHGASTWGVERIDAPDAWSQYGTMGEGVRVAVLDTGVDPDHPDLSVTEWASFDSQGDRTHEEPQDYDPNGHGTHTAGTLTAGDGGGVHHGVAPGADLLAGAVLRDCGSQSCNGTPAQMYAGMEWAVEQDADVISMSVGAIGYSGGDIDYVRNAEAAGSMVVAASGNRGQGTSASPANTFDAFGVGAADTSNNVPAFSSGETIDTDADWGSSAPSDWPDTYVAPRVIAPGVWVNSTAPGGGYTFLNGTSMATPHVAGAAVLVESATETNLSPNQLESALEDTAVAPSGADPTRYGAGVIDVDAAIASVTGSGSPEWAVSIDSVSSGVAGEPVTVTATVSNTGTADGQTTVAADLPGVATSSTPADVAAGGSETVTLSLATSPEDDGNHTLSVTAGGDADQEPVELLTPARFAVVIDSVSQPTAGDPIDVTARVTNVGDVEGTAQVGLEVATLTSTSTSVTVPAGATRTPTLSVPTAAGDAGTYDLTVTAGDSTATGEATVVEQPASPVTLGTASLDGTVVDGADRPVASQVWVSRVEGPDGFNLSISRIGPGPNGTGLFELRRIDRSDLSPVERSGAELRAVDLATVSGLGIASVDGPNRLVNSTAADGAFALSSPALDNETTVSLSALSNGTGARANATVTVTADDQRTTTLAMPDATAPSLLVESMTRSPEAGVPSGQPLEVRVAVSNVGDATAVERIRFEIDGTAVGNESVTVAGGARATVVRELSTDGLLSGTHRVSARTNGSSRRGLFTIESSAWYSTYVDTSASEPRVTDQLLGRAISHWSRPGEPSLTDRQLGTLISWWSRGVPADRSP